MHGSSVADYYDEFWSAEQQPQYRPDPQLSSLIFRHVTPTTRCLDVGCGTGNSYAPELARRAATYLGVDVSEDAVAKARASGLNAQTIADAAELPFPDGSFDLVVCVEVLEHLFAPHEAVREIRRVLRPGGRLVASTPNVAYWRLRANLLIGVWNPIGDELSLEQPWRDPHIRFFTPATLERMLRAAGFSSVRVGAHNGRLLDHLSTRSTDFGQSRAYAWFERRFPALLGLTLHAEATA